MPFISTPPTMAALLEAVERIRAGEDALADLRSEAESLLETSARVAEGLDAQEPPPPEAPEDQRQAFEEGQARFRAGLERMDEGLRLMVVAADEGDPDYMEMGLAHLNAGVASIASVGAVWAGVLQRYGLVGS